MLVNVRLPHTNFEFAIEESALVKVTGMQCNPSNADPHDVAEFVEYWIGHPALGGVNVHRSAAVIVLKPPTMKADTGVLGNG